MFVSLSSDTNSTAAMTSELYYDPYEVGIHADPYPVFRRLREEAPLYRNEKYDFYAVSRYDDCERGLLDRDTYISGRGAVLEMIKASFPIPPGVFIFEDPPRHTVHRGVVSRVFTPKKMAALEPKIRRFCADSLDPLIGAGGFDFIADLGAQMPMRVIGMLLGIPEQDQEAIRDHVDASLRTEAGEPMKQSESLSGTVFSDYIDWRVEHPSDDLMTELLNAEFEDETGTKRRLAREEILTYVNIIAGAGNETTNRLIGWTGKVLAEHPDQRRQLALDPSLIPECDRGAAALRATRAPHRPLRRARRRAPRRDGSRRRFDGLPGRIGEPRRPPPSGRRPVRHPPQHRPAPHVRLRSPLLSRRSARPARGPRRPRGDPEALPGVGRGHGPCQARVDLHRARLGHASGVHAVTRSEPVRQRRRRYDSPVRRERAAQTRDRIVSAGAELLHGFPVWNWRALTVRRVAELSGVTERTVYRHFASEQELRDAVFARLEQEAAVDLEALELAGVRDFAARVLRYVASFPLESRTPRDPTLSAAHARQRAALLAAVASSTHEWSESDRVTAAAMFDVLWSVMSYERLVADWDLQPEQAIRGVTWVIGLVEEAIRNGRRPSLA